MTTLWRWLYRGSVTLSSALLVVAIMAWVWSYLEYLGVDHLGATGPAHSLVSQRGAVYVSSYPRSYRDKKAPGAWWFIRLNLTNWVPDANVGLTPNRWIPLRVGRATAPRAAGIETILSTCVITYWFLALLFGALPTWAAWRWLRRKPRGRGFDLEATRPLKRGET